MTNTEYEAASIAAVTGEAHIEWLDGKIAAVTKQLEGMHELRRELINRYNLNKCEHVYTWDSAFRCVNCGAARPSDSSSGDDSWDTDRRPGDWWGEEK